MGPLKGGPEAQACPFPVSGSDTKGQRHVLEVHFRAVGRIEYALICAYIATLPTEPAVQRQFAVMLDSTHKSAADVFCMMGGNPN